MYPHIYRNDLDSPPFFFSQTVQPLLKRVFLAIGQHSNHGPSFQVRKCQRILLVSLPHRDFIHAQHSYSTTARLATGSILGPLLENVQHRRFAQPLLESHMFAARLLGTLVNVFLVGSCLPTFGANPFQDLCSELAPRIRVEPRRAITHPRTDMDVPPFSRIEKRSKRRSRLW